MSQVEWAEKKRDRKEFIEATNGQTWHDDANAMQWIVLDSLKLN